MLNSDLVKIYGYMTKAFNQQVKNNAQYFSFDFMIDDGRSQRVFEVKEFYLERATEERVKIKYRPKAFTEQGIYMLITVLKGELVVKRSIILRLHAPNLKRE